MKQKTIPQREESLTQKEEREPKITRAGKNVGSGVSIGRISKEGR